MVFRGICCDSLSLLSESINDGWGHQKDGVGGKREGFLETLKSVLLNQSPTWKHLLVGWWCRCCPTRRRWCRRMAFLVSFTTILSADSFLSYWLLYYRNSSFQSLAQLNSISLNKKIPIWSRSLNKNPGNSPEGFHFKTLDILIIVAWQINFTTTLSNQLQTPKVLTLRI